MDMHDLHLDGNCEPTVLKKSLECAARRKLNYCFFVYVIQCDCG